MDVALMGVLAALGLGGTISKNASTRYLRMAIAVIIAVTGIRMWFQVLTQ